MTNKSLVVLAAKKNFCHNNNNHFYSAWFLHLQLSIETFIRNLSQTILQTVTCFQVKFGPLQIWRFAVQITGEKWKAVALDKAHEMCINKDVEAAISHPTDSYLQKTSLFLHTRIQTQKSFLKDLFQKGM